MSAANPRQQNCALPVLEPNGENGGVPAVHLNGTPYTERMTPESDLLTPLRRYWGYSTFRPLQERIVASLLAGHDACVVMPTGGGKSLCYQLPAAMLPDKTVVVVSPLIALMQDQVTQLGQMGIAAGMLNSSLPSNEQFKITRR